MIARLQAVARQSPDYTVGGVPAGGWLDDIDAIEAEARAGLDVDAMCCEDAVLDVERLTVERLADAMPRRSLP
jgi:hypothetical protein